VTTGPRSSLRLARLILRLASRVVAASRRADWLAEWEAELWVISGRGSWSGTLRFAVAGAQHALWRWREGTMRALFEDVRLAARRLARSPGYAAVVVTVLALGIGINTALFTALRGVLLRPSPYPDADRLVLVDLLLESRAGAQADTMPWSYPKFEMARAALVGVEELTGYALSTVTLTGAGDPTRIGLEMVSAPYMRLLGVRPVVGRSFSGDEEPPAEAPVLVLGHALWQSRFGGDPGVVGRTVTVEGASLEVIGVAPPGFQGLTGGADAWIPMAAAPLVQGPRRLRLAWAHWLRAIGRLPEGGSVEELRAEGTQVGRALTEAYPDPAGGGAHGMTAVPFLAARENPTTRRSMVAVTGGAALLLLIACMNVAGLLLARGSSRRGEIAVRAALGAGRARLATEVLAESVVLAAVGGALGVGLAVAAERWVRWAVAYALETSGSRGLQFVAPETLTADGTVLLFGLALALGTGLLFGALPARAASRADLAGGLRGRLGSGLGAGGAWSPDRHSPDRHSPDRQAPGRHMPGRLMRGRYVRGKQALGRQALVVAQLSLSLVLVAGAGLMVVSFVSLDRVALGFEPGGVVSARYELGAGVPEDEVRAFNEGLLERVGALPGVESASLTGWPPLGQGLETRGIRRVDDGPVIDYGDMEGIVTHYVSDGLLETLGVELVEGRGFGAWVGPDDPPVALVNETAAREVFGGGSALGHRIAVTDELTSEDNMAEVVGVVPDVRQRSLEAPVEPAVYFSTRQAPLPYGTILVRTAGDPADIIPALRGAVLDVRADVPLFAVATLESLVAAATARTRVITLLLATFALVALILSAVGLYGLVSYSVTRRTGEMGLRMALGADRRRVLGLVARGPVVLAALGCGVGLVAARWSGGVLAGLLFGVQAGDGRVMAAAVAVLFATAAAAAVVPAWRAVRVDPCTALRGE